MSGYWCFHRSLLDWNNNLFMKGNYAKVICLVLSEAAYKKKNYNGTELQVGEFVTSHEIIAKRCNITKGAARYTLKRLALLRFIDVRTSFKGTVITVLNYERYQKGTHFSLAEPAVKPQFTTTTNKKEKRIKNKEIYIAEFFNVSDEVNKFFGPAPRSTLERWKKIYDSENFCDAAENIMDCLKTDKNKKKYNNYISTLNNWLKTNNATKNDYKKYQEYETGQKLLAELNEVQRQCNEEYEKQQNG